MIWGPFLLALALGLIVSAGLYFAYLWPQVEPDEDAPPVAAAAPESRSSTPTADAAPASDEAAQPPAGAGEAEPSTP